MLIFISVTIKIISLITLYEGKCRKVKIRELNSYSNCSKTVLMTHSTDSGFPQCVPLYLISQDTFKNLSLSMQSTGYTSTSENPSKSCSLHILFITYFNAIIASVSYIMHF